MDKVKLPLDKATLTDALELVDHLMNTYTLTEREVVVLLKDYAGIVTDMTIEEQMTYVTKGLIDSKGAIVEGLLWAGRQVVQLTMDLPHSTIPTTSIEAKKAVDKIRKYLSPPKEEFDAQVKLYAKKYFGNDLGVAEAFTTLMIIYPPMHAVRRDEWKDHFIVDPPRYTRWAPSQKFASYFKKTIYIGKDVNLFLLGTYMAVKASIDLDRGECYIASLTKYQYQYDEWYQAAQQYVQASIDKAKKDAKPKRTIKRNTKNDTL